MIAVAVLFVLGGGVGAAFARLAAHPDAGKSERQSFAIAVLAAYAQMRGDLQPPATGGWFGASESSAYGKFADIVLHQPAPRDLRALKHDLFVAAVQAAVASEPVCESEQIPAGNDCFWTASAAGSDRVTAAAVARIDADIRKLPR